MTKRAEIDTQPIHVTRWDRVWVEGGVLYSSFRSGAVAYVVSMGPAIAFDGIARTRCALSDACILPLRRV